MGESSSTQERDRVEPATVAPGRRARARSRLAGRPAWQRHLLLLVGFALLAAPVVAHEAVANTELSVFDEWQYAERVYKVSEGDLFMRNGEVIDDWAQGTRACRGITRVVGPQPDPCWGKEPVYIANSAAADPPPYFWATGAVAGALRATGLVDNGLLAGRLVGALWAALSMWSLFLLARAVGASRAASLVVSTSVLLVPALLQQYTFVTPHALDVPVGAFAALATLRFLRREWPWWTLVLAGLGAAGVKGSNVAVVVALGIMLLAVIAWPGRRDEEGASDAAPPTAGAGPVAKAGRFAGDRGRAFLAGVVLAGSTVVLTVAWMLVVRLTKISDPPPPGDYMVDSLDPVALVIDSIRFLSPFGEGPLGLPSVWFLMAMTGSALAVWAGLARPQAPFVRQLAPGYLLGAALAPLVLDLMVFVTTGQYIGIHTRYGLALWPLGLAFFALLLRTRTSLVIAAAALLLYAAAPTLAGLDSIAM
jgi:Dolichyl-phosphate-mannose-protein mannosyltransferase